MHTGARVLTAIIGLGLILTFILLGYRFSWTGFSGTPGTPAEAQAAKNLWDWLDLLIVPVVLALGAYYLESTRQHTNRHLELDRQRQQILDDCINKISELSLSTNLNHNNKLARNLARTRVLTALKLLNGARKSQLLQFLYELGMIDTDPIIVLIGADFSGVDLDEAVLPRATIHGAYFNDATIRKSNLESASLIGCDFSGVNFSESNLRNADLSQATLMKANFNSATLEGTNLSECDLETEKLSAQQKEEAIF